MLTLRPWGNTIHYSSLFVSSELLKKVLYIDPELILFLLSPRTVPRIVDTFHGATMTSIVPVKKSSPPHSNVFLTWGKIPTVEKKECVLE
jgi:hypothetical protein